MILGIGADLCSIARIQASLDRFGDRFLDRLFTPAERAVCDARAATRTAAYAKRFAAKEACAKALGTGIGANADFGEIGVVNLPSGAPTLVLAGAAKARLDALTPAGHAVDIHVTLTDDHPWAQAFVILYARRTEQQEPA